MQNNKLHWLKTTIMLLFFDFTYTYFSNLVLLALEKDKYNVSGF